MNKKTLIGIQITLWSCIVIFLASIFVYAIATDSKIGLSEVISIGKEMEYEVDLNNIEEISLDLASQDVFVYASNDDKLYIKHHTGREITEKEKLKVTQNGNTISITKPAVVMFNLFNLNRWNVNEQVEIYIPNKYMGDIDFKTVSGTINMADLIVNDMRCQSTSGEITLSNIQAKELTVHETSGNFELKNAKIEAIKTKTTSGDVKIKEIETDSIKASQVSGNLEVEGICNTVDVDSVSGEIELDLDQMLQSIDAKTVSGDVDINIPDNNGFDVIFSTVSGDLESNFDLLGSFGKKSKEHNKKYSYKDGGIEIAINTTSGDLSIHKN